MSEADKPKTARSYRGALVDDNAVISINIKWLIQLIMVTAAIVFGYYRIETRIGDLERGIGVANEEIAVMNVSKIFIDSTYARGFYCCFFLVTGYQSIFHSYCPLSLSSYFIFMSYHDNRDSLVFV